MLRYLILQLSDDSPSFCHYENKSDSHKLLSARDLIEAIRFSMKENLAIQMIFPPYQLPHEYWSLISGLNMVKIASSDSFYSPQADVLVYKSIKDLNDSSPSNEQICVLLLDNEDLTSLGNIDGSIFLGSKRLVVSLQGISCFGDKEFDEYARGLHSLSLKLEKVYKDGGNASVNVLSDILFTEKMNNCNAGVESITIAPNGKAYLCPAFYYDSPESSVGNCSGVDIKNRHLLELEYAPICKICDAYHCRRCIWLNQKLTGELNTPSKQQCILSHIERNQGKDLLAKIRKIDSSFASGRTIKEIEYLDPFELISK